MNLFVGGGSAADPALVDAYAERLAAEAERAGVALGTPRFDDDAFGAKVDALVAETRRGRLVHVRAARRRRRGAPARRRARSCG